jgi:hypothetical protein
MTKTISHLYNDYASAEAAVGELQAAGVKGGDISIVASNAEGLHKSDDGVKHVDIRHDKDRDGTDDRTEGARTGAGIGGVAVGAAGLAAGVGLLAIPGIGPIVAAGWAASALAGVVAGSVTGGVIGALVESGVSKEDADVYAETVRRGGALVIARVADDDAVRFQSVLDRSGVNAGDRATAYRAAGWKSFDPAATPYTSDQVRSDRALYATKA